MLLLQKNSSFIYVYIKDLIDQLSRKDVHNAVIRNTLRILEQISIPEEYHGRIMNACFSFIEKHNTPIAIKAYCLTTLNNLNQTYPAIMQELKLIIEERWDKETPAFRSRAKQILRGMI